MIFLGLWVFGYMDMRIKPNLFNINEKYDRNATIQNSRRIKDVSYLKRNTFHENLTNL